MMQFFDERLPPNFWAKVVPEPNTGCWLWVGRSNWAGYGRTKRDGKDIFAHRVSYDVVHGAPPFGSGLELDHRCHNRICCNPDHLEAVTHAENVRRGNAGWHHRVRTRCRSGHLYDLFFNGYRRCSICTTAAKRKYKSKIKLQQATVNA